ncbi:MAG: DUF6580 family putative transport protein [Gammaproteobacteria bacterium]|nr:DUF6580 family putative transport protein [Gammaproteobacteria bacterium]
MSLLNRINFSLSAVFLLLMVISRLIPHPPDFTPTIVLSVLLRELFARDATVVIVVLGQLISDIFLSILHHYPLWGSWSFFVYSGLMFSTLFFQFNLFQLLSATVLYWSWTNLGVFIFSGLYFHTVTEFIRCYVFALPFLTYSFLGVIFYYGLVRGLALDRGPLNRVFFTAL